MNTIGFRQPCPDWLPAYARRTSRLAHTQRSVATILGGQINSRLLTHLNIYMSTSHNILIRLVRKWQQLYRKHLMPWELMTAGPPERAIRKANGPL